jgi:serine/threonine-protein kinase/endoribonuclease IRE1
VKRMLKDFYALAEKESEILLRGDAHPNVVSYFLKEEDDRFVYLGLSYCSLTVGDMFESEETLRVGGNDNNESFVLAPRPDCLKAKAAALSNERRLLNQLAAGLAHLHALGVVHRDLVSAKKRKRRKKLVFKKIFFFLDKETAQHFVG